MARAEAIERETARLAAGLARNSMATGGGGLTSIDEARDAEAQRVFDLDRSRDVALRMAAAETEAAAAKRAGAASADRRRRILAAVGLALGGLVIVARVRK